MKENVGRMDQAARLILGPSMILLGYARGGRKGRLPGLLGMVAGAIVLESGITRVCPLNAWLGIDTRTPGLAARDREEIFREESRPSVSPCC